MHHVISDWKSLLLVCSCGYETTGTLRIGVLLPRRYLRMYHHAAINVNRARWSNVATRLKCSPG